MKTLYLENIAGIAGDMFTASFLDAGLVTPHELQQLCEKLAIPEVEIVVSTVTRTQMRATHIDVHYDKLNWQQRFPSHSHDTADAHSHESSHFHVHFRELERFVMHSTLAEKTKIMACKILDVLAEAEAHCHGMNKDEVAFHELGMVDSLMDIVMAAHCISTVNPDSIIASPIKLGRGLVVTAHGTLPVPPPVSAALMINMPTTTLPNAIQKENIELSTPTGLAILKTLQPIFSPEWPEGKVLAQGYGAGTMDLGCYPNLFRICLLETQEEMAAPTTLPYLHDFIIEIVANYDDASPEYLACATEKLFAYGALDVWQTTAAGKKGRVMIILSVLVEPAYWAQCVDFILQKTPTFGLRYKRLERLKLERYFETRITEQGPLQVKVGCDTQGKKIKEKFEYENIRQVWDKNVHN